MGFITTLINKALLGLARIIARLQSNFENAPAISEVWIVLLGHPLAQNDTIIPSCEYQLLSIEPSLSILTIDPPKDLIPYLSLGQVSPIEPQLLLFPLHQQGSFITEKFIIFFSILICAGYLYFGKSEIGFINEDDNQIQSNFPADMINDELIDDSIKFLKSFWRFTKQVCGDLVQKVNYLYRGDESELQPANMTISSTQTYIDMNFYRGELNRLYLYPKQLKDINLAGELKHLFALPKWESIELECEVLEQLFTQQESKLSSKSTVNPGHRKLKIALDLLKKGEIEQSTRLLKELAYISNIPSAITLYGFALREGLGCKINKRLGFKCLRSIVAHYSEEYKIDNSQCTREAFALSALELGNCFTYGWGCESDSLSAKLCYNTLNKLGISESYLLGNNRKESQELTTRYYRLMVELLKESKYNSNSKPKLGTLKPPSLVRKSIADIQKFTTNGGRNNSHVTNSGCDNSHSPVIQDIKDKFQVVLHDLDLFRSRKSK